MAILGVLLGITMTVLAGVIWFVRKEYRYVRDLNHGCTLDHERIAVLERRKALLTEAVTSQPKPAGVNGQKLRTWNEDAAPAEAVTR